MGVEISSAGNRAVRARGLLHWRVSAEVEREQRSLNPGGQGGVRLHAHLRSNISTSSRRSRMERECVGVLSPGTQGGVRTFASAECLHPIVIRSLILLHSMA